MLDPKSCVVGSSFEWSNMGRILWSSKNVSEVLRMEQATLNTLFIDMLIPKIISKWHKEFMLTYLESAKSDFVN